ncbi:esterase/lipase family protein [Streptomyces sp. NPDC054829]
MTNDLVVVLPGITGSTLRTKDGTLVWAPTAGAVLDAIKSFGRSVNALRLPEGIGDEHPGDGVEPVALMDDLHLIPGIWTPVKGYNKLLDRLRTLGHTEEKGNLLPVPYDWRLSNRYNADRLRTIVQPALERWQAAHPRNADAQLTFVCHSMGGLIARWYIEKCGGADHTRKLVTLGTPYRGAAKALDQLVNGAHQRLGPLSFDLTVFARTLPSLHQLLPEYACIEAGAQPGGLVKTTEVEGGVPELDSEMTRDAMLFHTDLQAAEEVRSRSLTTTHAIVGTKQNTPTTARLQHRTLTLRTDYSGQDLYGDGTVPLVGACRADVPMNSNTLRRVPDQHGNLQRNKAALDELESVLTTPDLVVRAPALATHLRLDVPEVIGAGEPLTVRLAAASGIRRAVRLTVTDKGGHLEEARVVVAGPEPTEVVFEGLKAGAYGIAADGTGPGSPVAGVGADILVWD